MKQQPFEEKYAGQWQAFEQMLGQRPLPGDFALQYRRICYHMAIARSRHYSAGLCQRLNDLTLRGHEVLYASRDPWHLAVRRFVLVDFPDAMYRNRVFVWAALALFFVPLLLTALTCYLNEEFILSLMTSDQVANFESMYDPLGEHQQSARNADDDWLMFGFYIKNNIGIAFQTFASGIFACVGSIFFLLFNGLMIGAATGHLSQMGFHGTFFPFVIGHGSLELTAIGFAGAAGLRLGYALINPHQFSRLQAVRTAGSDAVKIIYVATVMLLLAAFIEAFWSSSRTIPDAVKYAVGAILWCLVIGYCVFCLRKPNRRYEPR